MTSIDQRRADIIHAHPEWQKQANESDGEYSARMTLTARQLRFGVAATQHLVSSGTEPVSVEGFVKQVLEGTTRADRNARLEAVPEQWRAWVREQCIARFKAEKKA